MEQLVEIEELRRENSKLTKDIVELTARHESTLMRLNDLQNRIRELDRITEERSAELSSLIEVIPDAVYIGNLHGITNCNTAALKMLGATSITDLHERIGDLGKKFNVRWPDSGRPLREDELQFTRALKGETVVEEVLATNAQTGRDVHIRAADAPIILNGEIIGAVAINSDISERIKAEEETLVKSTEIEAILSCIADGVIIYDKQGRIVRSNAIAEEMLKYPKDVTVLSMQERIARGYGVWTEEGRQLTSEEMPAFRAAVHGETVREQIYLIKAGGEPHWINISATPLIISGKHVGGVASLSDITERKKAEDTLRTREAQMDAFFANSPFILNLFDENFCYINTDKLTPTYYGLNRETIKGKSVKDLSKDFKEQTGVPMMRVLETGEPILNAEFQAPVAGRGGEFAYWHTSFFRVPLGDGKWGVGVISFEVTEIKRSEQKLKDSEERFRLLADNISQFAWIADKNGTIQWYNKRWFDYTGTTFQDVKGWGWTRVHHPEHVNRVLANFKKAIKEEEQWEDTFPLLGKDGKYRWFLSRALPIRDENGKISTWFGTNTDITERLKAEEALQLVNEKLYSALQEAEEGRNILTALMEYIPIGITIADAPDVNIRMVSQYGQDLLEKPGSEITGIPAPEHPSKWGVYRSDAVTPGRPEELPLSRATMKGEIVKNEEWYVTRSDGTLIPILCNAAPILDKNGKVVGGVIGWQDIADLKRIEKEMRQRNEELSRFIYTVSHDLKSPLVTIKMFTSYLRDGFNNSDKIQFEKDLAYVENATDKMGVLLGEILQLSRIGRKEEPKTEVSLETIVKEAVDLVAGSIRRRGVKMVYSAPPVILYGYAKRFQQLYQNLIDNAVKFMGDQPNPEIEIGMYIDENRKNEIVLFVRDNGIGIDPQLQIKLFGLFEKLDPKSEGTGIGLASVKRIVEVHGGNIWVSSKGYGMGTTFYFTLEKTRIKA